MQIPLTSLSFADWLVYADYCAEYRKPKDEQYARRVGKALQKMHLSGTEHKCALAFMAVTPEGTSWQIYKQLHPSCKPVREPDFTKVYLDPLNHHLYLGGVWGRFAHSEWRWLTPNESRTLLVRYGLELRGFRECDVPKWSPADIHHPERHRRLIAKFWRVLVRRSSGIPNSILG